MFARLPLQSFAVLMLLAMLLGGCGQTLNEMTTSLTPGKSTRADVEKKFGTPEMVHDNPDGSKTLEYPKGPMGKVTYMVTINAKDVLVESINVLDDAHFVQVTAGQSRAEVRRILGRPAETMIMTASKEEVWSWNFKEVAGNDMKFHAYFDLDGKIRKTGRTLEQPN